MPRKPKRAREMTSDELAKRVFPPAVKRHLKRVAGSLEPTPPKPLKPDDSNSQTKDS